MCAVYIKVNYFHNQYTYVLTYIKYQGCIPMFISLEVLLCYITRTLR